MKRLHQIVTIFLFLGFIPAILEAQTTFTLEEAIEYALDHHISMRNAELNGEDALWQYREAKSIGMPQVSIDGNYNYYFIRPKVVIEDFISPAILGILNQTSIRDEVSGIGGDTPSTLEAQFVRRHSMIVGLNASVYVFNGNYLKGLKVGKMFIELARNQKALTEQDIRTNVTRAYQSIIITQKNIDILDRNIQNVTSILNETRAMYESGFVEELDVDRLVLSKENLDNERIKLTRLHEVSKNVLKFQMAYPLQDDIAIEENLEVDVNRIILEDVNLNGTIDLSNRPEHNLLLESLALDEADLDRIKQGYLPSLYANIGLEGQLQRDKFFNQDESGILPNGVFGLSANIPLYDGRDTRSKIERKKIVMEKRQNELNEFDRSLALQVFNARVDLINARETYESTIRAVNLSQKIYDKAQIKYKNGVGSSLELAQAESDLYQSQSNYVNALYDILVAKTSLDIATGLINKN